MTRFKVQDKRYRIPHIKTLREYDETFPNGSPELFRVRLPSCPDVLPSFLEGGNSSSWEDPLPGPHEGSAEENPNPYLTAPIRRHSWSVGTNNNSNNIHHSSNIFAEIPYSPNLLFSRRFSSDSRRSSVASVPEPIEECLDDEETDDNSSAEYDYMNCAHCNPLTPKQKNTHNSSNPMKYCYKCKHLFLIKTTLQSSVSRHSSWSGESYSNSPRRSRRTSLNDDLPVIAEPYVDAETNDTRELQISVEKEVDKLVKFNRTSEMSSWIS